MKPQTFLGRIITCLTSHGTDYVLTGSLSVALHGRPRILKDFDIVLRAPILTTIQLEAAFPAPHFSVLYDECTIVTLRTVSRSSNAHSDGEQSCFSPHFWAQLMHSFL